MQSEQSSKEDRSSNREPGKTRSIVNKPAATIVGHPSVPAGKGTAQSSTLDNPELADYQLVRHLGGGGMGVVYLYRNLLMDRLEVLKVLSQSLVNQPQAIERFLREIQSAAQLNHRNIVRAYTAIRWKDGLILSMEYVEGQDLAARVENNGPMSVAEACSCVYQAAKGLQHAAQARMVHRDIKPANLILDLVREKGVVKILDFGLAKVTSERAVEGGLTRQGFLLGSPDYMAPEQIRNPQSADGRADIYSLGCTFYYLLTGGPPFDGNSLYDILQAHHSTDANPLNAVRNDVPLELAAIAAKMMAKNPEDRFPTASAVAEAILPFFRPGTGSASRSNSKEQPAPGPDKPSRSRTVVEGFPMVDLGPPTLPGRSGTMIESPMPNSARYRSGTMVETALPERMGKPIEPNFGPKAAVPTFRQPGVLAAVGAAVVAMIALVAGLAFVMKKQPDAAPTPSTEVAKATPKLNSEPLNRKVGFGGISAEPKPSGFPLASLNEGMPKMPVTPAPSFAVTKPPDTSASPIEPLGNPEPNSAPPVEKNEAAPANNAKPTRQPKFTPGPDGFFRPEFRDVAAAPQDYENLRIIPTGYFKISTTIRQEDKGLGRYGTLVVCDPNDAKLTNEYGKATSGLPIVLDDELATTFGNFLAAEKIKTTLKPICKVVPTMEVRKSQDQWLAVIVDLEVMMDEDERTLLAGDIENAFEIMGSGRNRFRRVRGHGTDWFQRLGGEKERQKIKHALDVATKAAKRKQNFAKAAANMAVVSRNSLRWAAEQEAVTNSIKQRVMSGR